MSAFCTGRHKWKVDGEFLSDFPLPNGQPSGTKRLYQTRKCVNCPAESWRWKPAKKIKLSAPLTDRVIVNVAGIAKVNFV